MVDLAAGDLDAALASDAASPLEEQEESGAEKRGNGRAARGSSRRAPERNARPSRSRGRTPPPEGSCAWWSGGREEVGSAAPRRCALRSEARPGRAPRPDSAGVVLAERASYRRTSREDPVEDREQRSLPPRLSIGLVSTRTTSVAPSAIAFATGNRDRRRLRRRRAVPW